MDPNTVQTPNFDLPPVQLPEAAPDQSKQVETPPGQMTEQHNLELPAVAPPPQAPVAASTTQSSMPLAVAPAGQAAFAAATTVPTNPTADDLDAADDDLIEKAWVKKAKDIVDQTREDPYKQNKEITKVKSQYIKKRYNKDIKLSDE